MSVYKESLKTTRPDIHMEVHDTLEDAPAAKKTKAFGAMVTLI